nr:LdOrf-35 peptide [Calliteara abietis nucleopolyhedrovirus]
MFRIQTLSWFTNSNMSLTSKLIVYNYYGTYNDVHDQFGESYHLHRIAQEYLTDSFVEHKSCIERDVETAQRLIDGECTFDEARRRLNDAAADTIKRLNAWYRSGATTGICNDVCRVLTKIDQCAPLEKRLGLGERIFNLDELTTFPLDIANNLRVVIKRFFHFMRNNRSYSYGGDDGDDKYNNDYNTLERVAKVFNPSLGTWTGWWYNKFCVMTYMHKITCGTVPDELTGRLTEAATKFIKLTGDNGSRVDRACNNPDVIAKVYGRFCGIAKEHFAHHKTSSVYMLFQYMRDENCHYNPIGGYSPVRQLSVQCRQTYSELRPQIDYLYLNCATDKQKNAMFDLLCCANSPEIDVDFNYIVENFYATNKSR